VSYFRKLVTVDTEERAKRKQRDSEMFALWILQAENRFQKLMEKESTLQFG
jgi:hypothetical protein